MTISFLVDFLQFLYKLLNQTMGYYKFSERELVIFSMARSIKHLAKTWQLTMSLIIIVIPLGAYNCEIPYYGDENIMDYHIIHQLGYSKDAVP